jgi:hypothetical protein
LIPAEDAEAIRSEVAEVAGALMVGVNGVLLRRFARAAV